MSELRLVSKKTHSTHLMEMINTAIRLSELTISEIDGFAVTKGPGTFTGLRIGLSTVKGFAAASGKPVVGVSSLDALACQFSFSSKLICSLLDARRKEVYFSRYRFEDGKLRKEIQEQVSPPDKSIDGINEPCIFVGNGALLYQKIIVNRLGEMAFFASPCQNTILASAVANIGLKRFEINDADNIAKLVPHYIRKPDAQLNLL